MFGLLIKCIRTDYIYSTADDIEPARREAENESFRLLCDRFDRFGVLRISALRLCFWVQAQVTTDLDIRDFTSSFSTESTAIPLNSDDIFTCSPQGIRLQNG